MSRVVYVSAPLGIKLGPPPPVICKTCRETTASCRCHDEWFALAERVRARAMPTGEGLRAMRVAVGLTQYWVAKRLGVTVSAISHLEAGRHGSPRLIRAYAAVFGGAP